MGEQTVKRWHGAMLLGAGLAVGALGMRLAEPLFETDASDAATAPASAVGGGLHVEDKVQNEAGLRLARLEGTSEPGASDGFARALDLSPLAAIASDIAAATAAHDASARELARLAGLVAADAGASRRDLDAARAQEGQDRARLTLACERPTLEFGAGLGRLGCAAMAKLAAQAARGDLAIVRLDFPDGPVPDGAEVDLDLGPDGARIAVHVLGPAIAGDTQLQTAGTLALVHGAAAHATGVGRIIGAHRATGSARAGMIVPREAIVRADGTIQVYRATGPEDFERVPLERAEAVPSGWFVPAGGRLKSGDRIVVAGAGTLLGLERSASGGQSGDD